MAGTSVTGKGKGAAQHKGPKNGRDTFVPLLSPHVVAAGLVTLSSGVATVTFPAALSGAGSDYAVILTPQAATTTAPRVTGKTDNSDGDFSSFDVAGANVSHAWVVVKNGNA